MKHRTSLQREADKLDLDVYRMINRLEQFIIGKRGGSVERVDAAALALRAARREIRVHMHPEDLERTEDS